LLLMRLKSFTLSNPINPSGNVCTHLLKETKDVGLASKLKKYKYAHIHKASVNFPL